MGSFAVTFSVCSNDLYFRGLASVCSKDHGDEQHTMMDRED